MLEKLKHSGVEMNVEIHFLYSYLDRFLENLGNFSDEQGK